MNWKEYKAIYNSKIRKVPVHATIMGEFYNKYVSIYMTYIFYKARFSANIVTALSSITLVIAMAVICLERGPIVFLIHIILLQLSGIIDIVDGQIARLTNTGSKFGQFFDLALDRINLFFLYVGYGLALYRDGDLGSLGKIMFFTFGSLAYIYYCELGLIRSLVFTDLSGTMQNLRGGWRNFIIKIPYQLIHLNVVFFIYSIGYSSGHGYSAIVIYGIFAAVMCFAQVFYVFFAPRKSL
jgi:hypothetical protein